MLVEVAEMLRDGAAPVVEGVPNFFVCFFFFQAEDGIRDVAVTGVQTCALPICGPALFVRRAASLWRFRSVGPVLRAVDRSDRRRADRGQRAPRAGLDSSHAVEIGRASCRERVEVSEGACLAEKRIVESVVVVYV